MKNNYKILIAFISVLLVSNADDVENRPVIESVSTPELIAPETAKQYVLTEENGQKRLIDSWSAKYSDNVRRIHALMDKRMVILQMLKPTTSNSTQVAILKDLNQTAIELGAEPGVPTLFDES
jgi:hypothetical protein